LRKYVEKIVQHQPHNKTQTKTESLILPLDITSKPPTYNNTKELQRKDYIIGRNYNNECQSNNTSKKHQKEHYNNTGHITNKNSKEKNPN
jgi:hypothetical protein